MKKLLITGSDGFIGSCLLEELNNSYKDVASIDTYDTKSCDNQKITTFKLNKYDTIIHLGAISETNDTNNAFLFKKNIFDTLTIFEQTDNKSHIIYASSAAVYGEHSHPVSEDNSNELGYSLYAKSKKTVDDIVRNFLYNRRITGLRFFNVCSFDKESHKIQPSPTYSFTQQLKNNKSIKLFHDSHLIFRDFIFITNVIDMIIFHIFEYSTKKAEIFNIGSGKPVSFEQIADAMISKNGYGKKIYIDKPSNLTNNYQTYTCADMNKMINIGYNKYIPSILEQI